MVLAYRGMFTVELGSGSWENDICDGPGSILMALLSCDRKTKNIDETYCKLHEFQFVSMVKSDVSAIWYWLRICVLIAFALSALPVISEHNVLCWRGLFQNIGLILSLHLSNERRRYKVPPTLIGWAQT